MAGAIPFRFNRKRNGFGGCARALIDGCDGNLQRFALRKLPNIKAVGIQRLLSRHQFAICIDMEFGVEDLRLSGQRDAREQNCSLD